MPPVFGRVARLNNEGSTLKFYQFRVAQNGLVLAYESVSSLYVKLSNHIALSTGAMINRLHIELRYI
jgi:hypothetical protein